MNFIETCTSYKDESESRIINWLNYFITVTELSAFIGFIVIVAWAMFYGVVSFLLLLTTLCG